MFSVIRKQMKFDPMSVTRDLFFSFQPVAIRQARQLPWAPEDQGTCGNTKCLFSPECSLATGQVSYTTRWAMRTECY